MASRRSADAVSLRSMTSASRPTAAAQILQDIAVEAARRTSPGCADGQREKVGEAWLSALSFADRDLSRQGVIDDAIDAVADAISDPVPAPEDTRIDPASIPSWRSSTPFGDSVDLQHARILREALDRMPPRLSTLIRLRHGMGSMPPMSVKEIASILTRDEEDIETALASAMRLIRADLLDWQMKSTQGGDEAISQIPSRPAFRVSIRQTPAMIAERTFAAGVIAGTHVLVDSPAKSAARARAAEASERIDPAWLAREEQRRLRARTERLSLAARRRTALAEATTVITEAAIHTPTLSVGLKPDHQQTRFSIYAYDGMGSDGGVALLGGGFLTPSEISRRCDELKADLIRYRDRIVGRRRRIA